MYEAFYGLRCKPFQLNPDPQFYFASKQHRRAKAYLDYGVSRNDGFIVITGEIGAGKTTVLRNLLDGLAQGGVVAGNLVTTQLGAEDTLRLVGAAFGVRMQGVSKAELLTALEAFLVAQTSQGKRCLLVVDEAQNLTRSAIEELRMLSNFQLGSEALLQTFLVGQPEFREILRAPELEQFRQRIAASCHIGPLDVAETESYVYHRLKCAGSTGEPSFDRVAFGAIHKASHGIPRRINAICDRVLLSGFLDNRKHLTLADVEEVVRELDEEAAVPARGLQVQLDGGLSRLGNERDTISVVSRELSSIDAQQRDDRLLRLEQAMTRLEGVNERMLDAVRSLLSAIQIGSQRDGKP